MSEKRPLEIGCSASTCNQGLPTSAERHALRSPAGTLPGLGGDCMNCNAQGLVDWELCHHIGPPDFRAVTVELRKELIRDNYWGLELPAHILRKSHKRTREQLEVSTQRALRAALIVNHPKAGFQTSWAYNESATIISCAQHATGTCCRACVAKWFGIPAHLPLDDGALGLLARFAMSYVDLRLDESPAAVLGAAK